MSKCEIVVEFDRADRAYQAGETLSGTAYVTSNTDVPCNGVLIEQTWSTHGRGNRDGATIAGLEYDGQDFLRGQTVAYEFQFKTPSWPLTYHGHYLNVDNYIKVRLDVPWSLDPKYTEEYFLLPGPASAPTRSAHRITETGSPKKAFGCMMAVAALVAVITTLIGLVPVFFIAWLITAALGFLAFRNSLASRKLGQVTMVLARHRASPCERLPVSVEFSPTAPIHINSIIATLKAVEKVVSGSGTNRSTHTETVFEKGYVLQQSGQISVGDQVVSSDILIPPTNAWTFKTTDNELTWTMTLRVDIPNWPDWVASAELELCPAGVKPFTQFEQPPARSTAPPPMPLAQPDKPPIPLAQPPRAQPPIPPPAKPTYTPPEPPAAPKPEPEPQPQRQPEPQPEPQQQDPAPEPPEPESDAAAYARDIKEIVSSDRFGSERDELIARTTERTYDLKITIKSSSWTLESSLPLEYRNGRTIIARVEETESSEIAVHFPEDVNDKIDDLSVGDTLQLTVRPRKFNKFYDRMEALAKKSDN
ncbi:MAG: hypothetical protein QGH94_06530 [Phycisphaerae bacterium]|jgi:hypothetical protein|nr:hypothetical protein [Phycisphaerae bacterium]